ncbi:immunoglobulin superfamily member 3 [Protopterus annectens]|uniref:immunoglobulin superfamily member 3 n=1 Tax=Protopterus annectens TaxID=7888 RepID=UPI001CFBB2BA|nr:immunoglobulin superfamily member 3 [Protopterus annectens]
MGQRVRLLSVVNACCFLLCLGALLSGLTSAQRLVTVQTGPLYRVQGSHITILCNVSGYQGPSEQNFQWSVYFPSAPTREVQIISTSDPAFPYAIYGQRVRDKEIYIERLTGDSVRLHITNLQKTEEGEYECHTPNTDVQYHGSYSAKMNLTVIPDTLRVTAVPQTLSKIEGDSVELKCDVSKTTTEHTHLSVSWYIQKGSQKMEVLSLSRDFILGSGSSFTPRHLSGDIRLDKIGETSYKLTIYKLLPSDQGDFFCEGVEWIQDPDNSWFAVTKNISEKISVNVQATDKDFSVRLDTERRLYTVGETMELKCILDAQNVAERYFAISWAFNSTPVATVGPNAVAVLSTEFAQRESIGQLKLGKENDSVFVMKIYRLRLEDSGKYNCRVTEREKTSTGEFVDRENRRPKNVPITVQPLKSTMTVVLKINAVSILEGSTLKFTCTVSSVSGTPSYLSVTWQLLTNQNQHIIIAVLDKDGILTVDPSYLERSAQGDLQVEKGRPDSFTLGIYNTLKSDEGVYQCRVTEWIQDPDGNWEKLGEQTASGSISITALETGFSVTAVIRTPGVTYNDSAELHCVIRPRYPTSVRMSVTWRFQPAGSSGFYDIVTLTQDGAIHWGNTYPNIKSRAALERTESAGQVRLVIGRVSDGEAGKYQCAAELWRKNLTDTWIKLANRTSSPVEIRVSRPTSKLKVSKSKRSIQLVENSILQLNCLVVSQTSIDSRFSVLWYGQKSSDADGKLILKINHNSAYEYGTYADEVGLRGRLQFEKLSAGLFSLTVRKAKVGDSGSYYCHVEEWLLNPNAVWYKLTEEVSGLTEVTVKQPDKNLQVSKIPQTISFTENSHIPLNCSIVNRTSQDSRVSVEWYINKPNMEQQRIVQLSHNNVFHYGDVMEEGSLKTRFQFEKPSDGLYRLVVHNANILDSGSYFCHVEEWLINPDNVWYKRAEDRSESTVITVQRPEVRLQVEKSELNFTVKEKGNFQLDCRIQSQSKQESQFAISWYLKAKEESAVLKNEQVFRIDHDSVFGKEGEHWSGRLQFRRPATTNYSLTVQEAVIRDTGSYYCHVEEWVLDPNNMWYKLADDDTELTIVAVESTGSSLQSVICSNEALFYFVFFYPFPIFAILIIVIFLVRYKRRNSSKNSDSKNGVPLLWIKEPHLNYSPTCLEPPNLSIHPGTIE